MSLRDQLLKAGVVSKKAHAAAERAKKKERKKKQGNRDRKSQIAKAEAARREREQAEALQERRERREKLDAEREEREHALRVKQIVLGNAVRGRGKQHFWVRRPQSNELVRLAVHERIAFKLRCGELGVVGLAGGEPVVVARRAVDKLREIEPTAVWFAVDDTTGLSAPEEAFMVPDWDISLVPHRVREDVRP